MSDIHSFQTKTRAPHLPLWAVECAFESEESEAPNPQTPDIVMRGENQFTIIFRGRELRVGIKNKNLWIQGQPWAMDPIPTTTKKFESVREYFERVFDELCGRQIFSSGCLKSAEDVLAFSYGVYWILFWRGVLSLSQ